MSDVLKRILCLALALVVVFSFAGCRKSPVLEQTIYTQDAETDPDNQQTDNDEEHTQEDTTLPPRTTQQTASRQSEQTKVSAKPQSNPNNNNNRTNTTQGNQTPTNGNNANGQNNQQNPNNPNNGNNSAQGNTPNVNPDPNSNAIHVDPKAPYNPDEIPKDQERVAAYGFVGLYIEMLGGRNRLVATSQDLKENTFANQVFSDLAGIPQVWTGNGTEQMSDTDFQALLSANPETVIYQGASLDDNQKKQLEAREIHYVSLAPFNTTSNIISNVRTLGYILGKPEKLNVEDANKRAEDYIDWLEKMTKDKGHTFSGPNKWNLDQDKNFSDPEVETIGSYADEGQYTILIDGWDNGVNVNNNAGAAYSKTGFSRRTSPASYYLSLGGAANTAVTRAQDIAGGYTYFPVVPTPSEYNNSYVNNTWVPAGQRPVLYSMTNGLGGSNFKKIIVDSQDTRTKMSTSPAWQVGTPQEPGTGHSNINLDGVETQIIGKYDTIVNPYGIGSWTEGSPESPLEALWAEQIFYYDKSAEEAFDAIYDDVLDFYQRFYHVDDPSPYMNNIRDAAYKPVN